MSKISVSMGGHRVREVASIQLQHFHLAAYKHYKTVSSKMVNFSAFGSTARQKENILVIVLTREEKWNKRYSICKQTEKYESFKIISVHFTERQLKM